MSYFENVVPKVKWEKHYHRTPEEKHCFNADDFRAHWNTFFEAMGYNYHYCPSQESRPSLCEKGVDRGNERRELNGVCRLAVAKLV